MVSHLLNELALDFSDRYLDVTLGSKAFVHHVGQIPARHVRVNATDAVTARLQFVARFADFHTFSDDGAKGEAVRLLVRMLDRSIVPRAWQAVVLLDAASLLEGKFEITRLFQHADSIFAPFRFRRRDTHHNRRCIRTAEISSEHLYPSCTRCRGGLPSSPGSHDHQRQEREGCRGGSFAVTRHCEARAGEISGEVYCAKNVV